MADTNHVSRNKIILWNAQGLMNKARELKKLIQRELPSMVCINKTYYKRDNKPPNMKGYNKVVKNQENDHLGGQVIYIHKDINYTIGNIQTSQLETTSIKTNGITLVCVYKPAGTQIEDEDLEHIFQDDLVVAAGDYNAQSTSWNCHADTQAGKKLEIFIEENGGRVYQTPTRKKKFSNGDDFLKKYNP